jgi:predicted  nucleic acid-binding Zn-ribbon protein
MEAYEEIQALEDEKSQIQEARAAVLESGESLDAIAAQVVVIDADLESIEEELLEARRRYSQFSDARRMAYLTVDATVSVGEDLESSAQQPL